MDEDIKKRLDEQDKKLEEIRIAVEKTRKYLFWTFVVSIAVIVLPLIGLIFVIPQFLSTLNISNLGL